jgi:capsular polysaccharide transport system permease protein
VSIVRQKAVAQSSFLRALETQFRVIGALTLRELQVRFGRDNIGYLWLIAEPMMLATVISSLHTVSFTGGGDVTGMAPYPFTLVGYCLFIIFRGGFGRADHLLDHSTAMLYHHMIRPLDIVVVKLVVEVLGCLSSLIILMTVGIALGIADLPARPLYLFFAAFLISWLTFGLALLIAAYTYDSHFLSRFVHPFSYFMVPLSGAFVTVSFLPTWARAYMVWNPMVSIFEIARYGQFESASDQYMYWEYVVSVCAIVTYWGLIAIRRVRKRLRIA